MSTTTLTLATVRRVYEFLSRLTLVRRTSGAMGASVRSQVSCAPATQECCMACGMHIRNNIAWHAGKIACTQHAPICFCAAGQASCAARPEAISASRAPHVRAQGMSCCMGIATGMKNDASMLRMRHGHVHTHACRPLCARACRPGVFS